MNSSRQFRLEVKFENEHISARECIMFGPARLLRSWFEHRPSNNDELNYCYGGGWKNPLHGDVPACDFMFVLQYLIFVAF
jgi:hypothetical protein